MGVQIFSCVKYDKNYKILNKEMSFGRRFVYDKLLRSYLIPTDVCFDERNRYDVTNHVIGLQYRPLCNQGGTFAATQV